MGSKVWEGHHPRGTTLREALQGNVPLKGLCGGLSEGSPGASPRVLRGSAGFCKGPRDFSRFFGGSDPLLVTLRNCWNGHFHNLEPHTNLYWHLDEGMSGCRKRRSAQGVQSLFFVFGTPSITFWSLFRHFFAKLLLPDSFLR